MGSVVHLALKFTTTGDVPVCTRLKCHHRPQHQQVCSALRQSRSSMSAAAALQNAEPRSQLDVLPQGPGDDLEDVCFPCLVGAPRAVLTFRWQNALTDSDWSGDRESRKSSIVCVVHLGHRVVKSWISTQPTVATRVAIQGANETKVNLPMLMDFAVKFDGTVCTDATATVGISYHRGLCRTLHLGWASSTFWILDEVAEERFKKKRSHQRQSSRHPEERLGNHVETCTGARR